MGGCNLTKFQLLSFIHRQECRGMPVTGDEKGSLQGVCRALSAAFKAHSAPESAYIGWPTVDNLQGVYRALSMDQV